MYTKWHFLNFCPPNQWDDPDADGVERVSLVNISGKKLVFFFLLEFDYLYQPLCFQHPATSLGGKKVEKKYKETSNFYKCIHR